MSLEARRTVLTDFELAIIFITPDGELITAVPGDRTARPNRVRLAPSNQEAARPVVRRQKKLLPIFVYK
jgi:hypothetical protein